MYFNNCKNNNFAVDMQMNDKVPTDRTESYVYSRTASKLSSKCDIGTSVTG